ncbi:MAG: hypothetical protein ABI402_09455 [Ferruginibacter sp.]
MNAITFTKHRFIFLCLFFLSNYASFAQADCIFKDTIFNVDFGTEKNIKEFNLRSLKQYRQVNGPCPDDGFYSYTSSTSNCFAGDWLTITTDHTPNDIDGRMMLVNASETASDFFILNFEGFKASRDYEFGVWLLNVCKLNSGCSPLPPNILITLQTPSGKILADFKTGTLAQSDNPVWKRYFGMFTIPADETTVYLRMRNTTNGGCGNDFAMDDITFRECYPPPPPPPVVETPVPVIEKKAMPPISIPIVKKTDPKRKPIKKDMQAISHIPVNTEIVIKQTQVTGSKTNPGLPLPLLTRKNPLVKQIETDDGEILVELYDNGVIDGDTISVYDNNELIVSHQGLSEKPITIKIKVDPSHPHHELIMVADNLGSIPPNTSLMVVTANKKRYEVFISSSEQNNAKVVIQKKE